METTSPDPLIVAADPRSAAPAASGAASGLLGPAAREPIVLLAFALLSGLATFASLAWTRIDGGVAALWMSNGLLASALLCVPNARWRRWVLASALGQFIARLVLGDPVAAVAGLTLANLLEAWIAAIWVRRRVAHFGDMGVLVPLSRAALSGTLLACAVSATLAAPIVATRVHQAIGMIWLTWFSAHVLGMVIVGTLLLCLTQVRGSLLGRRGRRLDLAACVVLLAGVSAGIGLQQTLPLLFLAYLPLLLLTWRHGLAGVVWGIVVLTLASAAAAIDHSGPFALVAPDAVLARTLLLQLYVAAGCLLAIPTAVAMTERRWLDRKLRQSEARLQAVTDNVPAMVTYFDTQARYTYANAVALRSVDGDPSRLLGRTLREVRGDALWNQLEPRMAAALRGEPQDFEGQTDVMGSTMDYRAHYVPDRAVDGSVVGFYSFGFDITQAKQTERELERLARFDSLTGLANRRHFEEELDRAVVRAHRNHSPLLLLAIDVDRFKEINDSLGHATGDAVLRAFAQRIREVVYDVDLVARVGGDEFVVLVEYSPTAAVGALVAARVVAAMAEPVQVGETRLPVRASIGVGFQANVASASALRELADLALYDAKRGGRDGWALREG